ncbi:MAG: LD-carboxypeptidase, partial [Patescibacteria group bacterium]
MKKGHRITSSSPTIGVVVISAPEAVWNPEIYQRGIEQLKKRGISVVEGETVHSEYFYLAERPEKIAEGLHKMFLRDDIEAIMCAGGGTCINKVLPFIDFSLIRD